MYRCFFVATIWEITRRRDQFHKFDVGCDSVWAEHDNNFDNNHNRVNKQECQKSNPQIAFVTRLRQQDYDQHIPNLSLCCNKRLQNIFLSYFTRKFLLVTKYITVYENYHYHILLKIWLKEYHYRWKSDIKSIQSKFKAHHFDLPAPLRLEPEGKWYEK